ncbi:MAG: hypothetical protein KAJ17_00830, partial [Candidatus Krumholzibacteria bacterium]|nr:hypothetical protein [Candidatus Krumholzibacteria bacterium]
MNTNHSNRSIVTHPLVESVQRTTGFGALRSALDRGKGAQTSGSRIHLTGLRGVAPVFLLEAIRDRVGRPVVVVCPDQEGAEDVYSDLGTISTARTLLFPEHGIFPHR